MSLATSHPRPRMRRLAVSWVPVVAWASLIFAFSAQPNLRFVPDPGVDFVVRKIGHAVVFAVLALLIWRALPRMSPGHRSVAAFVLAACYAVFDELHQALVEGRYASVVDVGIDTTGILVALLMLSVLRRVGP